MTNSTESGKSFINLKIDTIVTVLAGAGLIGAMVGFVGLASSEIHSANLNDRAQAADGAGNSAQGNSLESQSNQALSGAINYDILTSAGLIDIVIFTPLALKKRRTSNA